MVCHTNGIHEGETKGLFHFTMKKPAGAALNACTCLSSSSCERQEGKLTPYCKIVNYLLATHAIEDIIAEADMSLMNFKQPDSQGAVEYIQALWTKDISCMPV